MPKFTAQQRKAIKLLENDIIAKDLKVSVSALSKAKIHAKDSTAPLEAKYLKMNETKKVIAKKDKKATEKPAKKSPAKSKAKKK